MFSRLIDCFLVDLPVTSLAVSPVGDFMVTTHVDDLGIYLWYNTTLYSNTPVRFLPEDYVPTLMDLPSSNAESTSKGFIFAISINTLEYFCVICNSVYLLCIPCRL